MIVTGRRRQRLKSINDDEDIDEMIRQQEWNGME